MEVLKKNSLVFQVFIKYPPYVRKQAYKEQKNMIVSEAYEV